jgi:hypothetical protein
MVKNSKKRVMSGGKGKVSRYTQKFKQAYKRFMKIGDNDDDNSKLKKMEEWGRMRGIYKFLKFQNHKYTGDSGEEKNALEKMEDNINKTPNNTGYKSAISCFQQSENDILSGEGENSKCIPEEDYIKGVGGMGTTEEESSPPVVGNNDKTEIEGEGETDTENETDKVINNNNDNDNNDNEAPNKEPTEVPTVMADAADDTTQDAEVPAVMADAADDTATAEVTVPDDNADTVVTEDETPPVIAEAPTADDTAEVPAVMADANAATADDTATNATEASTTVAVDNNETETQEGGRSKRRPRSSRRRGKSMKSKKGRRTRRR